MKSFSDFLQSDRRFLIAIAVLIFGVTAVPYLIGLQPRSDGSVFSGFVFGVEDGNSYIAKMRQGMLGDWIYRTPYTAYPQAGTFTNFSYLLLGKLAGGQESRLQLIILFQVFRFFGVFLCLWAGYHLAALLGLARVPAILVSSLTLIGNGLGWLVLIGVPFRGYNQLPLEFYSPESFGFLMTMGLPHLLFSRAGLFLSLAAFLAAKSSNRSRDFFKAGLWLVFSWIFQPQTPLIAYFLAGLMATTDLLFNRNAQNWKRWMGNLSVFSISSLPFVLISIFQFTFDPLASGWYAQNQIKSPPFTDYLLSYGLNFCLIIVGMVTRKKRMNTNEWFLLAWVLLLPVLVYAPYVMQRRLADGVWLAICALTFLVWQSRWNKVGLTAVVASSLLTSLILWIGAVNAAVSGAQPNFVPAERTEVYELIAELEQNRSVVVANRQLSNEIPAWTNLRVVIGHGPESILHDLLLEKVQLVMRWPELLDQTLPGDFDVNYLLYAPEDVRPAQFPEEWERIIDLNGYLLFRVK